MDQDLTLVEYIFVSGNLPQSSSCTYVALLGLAYNAGISLSKKCKNSTYIHPRSKSIPSTSALSSTDHKNRSLGCQSQLLTNSVQLIFIKSTGEKLLPPSPVSLSFLHSQMSRCQLSSLARPPVGLKAYQRINGC